MSHAGGNSRLFVQTSGEKESKVQNGMGRSGYLRVREGVRSQGRERRRRGENGDENDGERRQAKDGGRVCVGRSMYTCRCFQELTISSFIPRTE